MPDYGALIKNDTGLQNIQGLLASNQTGDVNARNAAIQSALVQFGEVPDVHALAQQLGMSDEDIAGVLGPDAQKLARDATASGLSTVSRLDQQHNDSLLHLKNELNKRGLLNSGEAGYQLDREGTGYRQAQFDSRAKLLQYLQQYQQGYLSAQQGRAGQLSQAYSDAAGRAYDNNPGQAGGTATLDHVDASGQPVYTLNGRLFNADGSAYAGPNTPTPPAAPTPPTPNAPDITTYPRVMPTVGHNIAV